MEDRDRERLDHLLDSALQQYGNVQPRTGLEGRILAGLSVRGRSARRRPWRLSFASALALGLIAIVIWVSGHGRVSNNEVHPPLLSGNSHQQSQKFDASRTMPQTQKRPTPDVHPLLPRRAARAVTASAPPRLEQFPSPRPPTEQERLLKAYATESPNEALEIAREQAQRERELEALYSNNSPEPNSDQER